MLEPRPFLVNQSPIGLWGNLFSLFKVFNWNSIWPLVLFWEQLMTNVHFSFEASFDLFIIVLKHFESVSERNDM